MSTAAQKQQPRRRRAPGLFTATLIVLAGVALVGSQYGLAVLRDIRATLPPTPVVSAVPVSTAVVDKAGLLLRPFTTANGRWRLPVTIAEVDRRFIDMLLAYEDQHFNEHQGIDWPSMLRAAVQYAGAGRIVSGGSTLTMQVARLIGGEPTRNIAGKLRQMVHADMLERSLSKDDILDALPDAGAPYRRQSRGHPRREPRLFRQGAEAADSTAECALLVALPQSPEARRPDRDVEVARARRASGARPHGRAPSRDQTPKRSQARASSSLMPRRGASLSPTSPRTPPRRSVKAHPSMRSGANSPSTARCKASLERLGAERARIAQAAALGGDRRRRPADRRHPRLGRLGRRLFDTESAGYVDLTAGGALTRLDAEAADLRAGVRAWPRPSREPDAGGPADGAQRPLRAESISTSASTAVPCRVRQALTELSLNIPAVEWLLDAVGPARLVARLKDGRMQHRGMPADTAPPSLAVGLGGVGVTLRDLVSALCGDRPGRRRPWCCATG
jgi:penicillin-binding protein 1C